MKNIFYLVKGNKYYLYVENKIKKVNNPIGYFAFKRSLG